MKCRYFCRLPLDISPVYLTRGISDGMSTALYIMGYEKACQFWRQHREEFNVILVTDDGKIHISENLKGNFQTEWELEMIESGSE